MTEEKKGFIEKLVSDLKEYSKPENREKRQQDKIKELDNNIEITKRRLEFEKLDTERKEMQAKKWRMFDGK